jgi:sirohydrochlorin ferrochelatase
MCSFPGISSISVTWNLLEVQILMCHSPHVPTVLDTLEQAQHSAGDARSLEPYGSDRPGFEAQPHRLLAVQM